MVSFHLALGLCLKSQEPRSGFGGGSRLPSQPVGMFEHPSGEAVSAAVAGEDAVVTQRRPVR